MWHDRFISSRFVFPLYDVPEPLPDGENSHSIAAVHALQYFGLLDRALVLPPAFYRTLPVPLFQSSRDFQRLVLVRLFCGLFQPRPSAVTIWLPR